MSADMSSSSAKMTTPGEDDEEDIELIDLVDDDDDEVEESEGSSPLNFDLNQFMNRMSSSTRPERARAVMGVSADGKRFLAREGGGVENKGKVVVGGQTKMESQSIKEGCGHLSQREDNVELNTVGEEADNHNNNNKWDTTGLLLFPPLEDSHSPSHPPVSSYPGGNEQDTDHQYYLDHGQDMSSTLWFGEVVDHVDIYLQPSEEDQEKEEEERDKGIALIVQGEGIREDEENDDEKEISIEIPSEHSQSQPHHALEEVTVTLHDDEVGQELGVEEIDQGDRRFIIEPEEEEAEKENGNDVDLEDEGFPFHSKEDTPPPVLSPVEPVYILSSDDDDDEEPSLPQLVKEVEVPSIAEDAKNVPMIDTEESIGEFEEEEEENVEELEEEKEDKPQEDPEEDNISSSTELTHPGTNEERLEDSSVSHSDAIEEKVDNGANEDGSITVSTIQEVAEEHHNNDSLFSYHCNEMWHHLEVAHEQEILPDLTDSEDEGAHHQNSAEEGAEDKVDGTGTSREIFQEEETITGDLEDDDEERQKVTTNYLDKEAGDHAINEGDGHEDEDGTGSVVEEELPCSDSHNEDIEYSPIEVVTITSDDEGPDTEPQFEKEEVETMPCGEVETIPHEEEDTIPCGEVETLSCGEVETVPCKEVETIPSGDGEVETTSCGDTFDTSIDERLFLFSPPPKDDDEDNDIDNITPSVPVPTLPLISHSQNSCNSNQNNDTSEHSSKEDIDSDIHKGTLSIPTFPLTSSHNICNSDQNDVYISDNHSDVNGLVSAEDLYHKLQSVNLSDIGLRDIDGASCSSTDDYDVSPFSGYDGEENSSSSVPSQAKNVFNVSEKQKEQLPKEPQSHSRIYLDGNGRRMIEITTPKGTFTYNLDTEAAEEVEDEEETTHIGDTFIYLKIFKCNICLRFDFPDEIEYLKHFRTIHKIPYDLIPRYEMCSSDEELYSENQTDVDRYEKRMGENIPGRAYPKKKNQDKRKGIRATSTHPRHQYNQHNVEVNSDRSYNHTGITTIDYEDEDEEDNDNEDDDDESSYETVSESESSTSSDYDDDDEDDDPDFNIDKNGRAIEERKLSHHWKKKTSSSHLKKMGHQKSKLLNKTNQPTISSQKKFKMKSQMTAFFSKNFLKEMNNPDYSINRSLPLRYFQPQLDRNKLLSKRKVRLKHLQHEG